MARPDPASVAPDPRALIDGQLVMLTRLAEIGMEIAEAAGRAATCGDETRHDPALAYSRAARAVRLTIALQSRLLADLAALGRADSLDLVGRAGVRRDRVHRLIERAIESRPEADDEAVEDLSFEVRERLEDEDDADIAGRPLAEVVAMICADLRLSPERTALALEACGDAAAPTFAARPPHPSPGPIPPEAGATVVALRAPPFGPGLDLSG